MTAILPQFHHCDCGMCEWLNFGTFFKFPCIVRIYAWFFMHCRNHHSDSHANHVITCDTSQYYGGNCLMPCRRPNQYPKQSRLNWLLLIFVNRPVADNWNWHFQNPVSSYRSTTTRCIIITSVMHARLLECDYKYWTGFREIRTGWI